MSSLFSKRVGKNRTTISWLDEKKNVFQSTHKSPDSWSTKNLGKFFRNYKLTKKHFSYSKIPLSQFLNFTDMSFHGFCRSVLMFQIQPQKDEWFKTKNTDIRRSKTITQTEYRCAVFWDVSISNGKYVCF